MFLFKNIFSKFSFIIIFSCIAFTSCSNFLNSASLKDELRKKIEYETSEPFVVRIYADSITGSIIPNNEDKKCRISDRINLEFVESKEYKFSRWVAVNKDSGDILTDCVKFYNPTSTVCVAEILRKENILIKPLCYERPVVADFYPVKDKDGAPKNSAIRLIFNHELSPLNDLSRISIWVNGNESFKNFVQPKLIGKEMLIAADNSNLIDCSDGIKEVSVRIPYDFYYKSDSEEKITIGESEKDDCVKSYLINNTTTERLELSFVTEKEYGEVIYSGNNILNYSDNFTARFVPKQGYKFIKWNVQGSSDSVLIDALDSVELSGQVVGEGTVIFEPVVISIPYITDYSPKNLRAGVNNDSMIEVYFSTPIDIGEFRFSESELQNIDNRDPLKDCADEYGVYAYYTTSGNKYFKNIQIENDYGENICKSFYKPVISENGKILKIEADFENLINMFGEEYSYVTVTISKNVKNELSTLSEDFVWDYKINSSHDTIPPVVTNFWIARTEADAQNRLNLCEVCSSIQSEISVNNHIKDNIWVFFEAIDYGCGVNGIYVVTKYIKDTEGNSVDESIKTFSVDNVPVANESVKMTVNVPLADIKDGLIEAEVYVKDCLGNMVKCGTYNFVLDSVMDVSSVRLYNRPPAQSSLFSPENFEESAKTIYLAGCQDFYYNNMASDYDKLTYKAYWGPDKNNPEYSTSDFNFKEDEKTKEKEAYFVIDNIDKTKHNYLTVEITDEVGNTGFVNWLIPGAMNVPLARTCDDHVLVQTTTDESFNLAENYYYSYFIHYYIDGAHFLQYTYDGINFSKYYVISSYYGKSSLEIYESLYNKEIEFYIQPYLRTDTVDHEKLNEFVKKYYQFDDGDDSDRDDKWGYNSTSSPLHFKYMDYATQKSVLGGVVGPFKVKVSENMSKKRELPTVTGQLTYSEIDRKTSIGSVLYSLDKLEKLDSTYICAGAAKSKIDGYSNTGSFSWKLSQKNIYYNLSSIIDDSLVWSDVVTQTINISGDVTPPIVTFEYSYRSSLDYNCYYAKANDETNLNKNAAGNVEYTYFWVPNGVIISDKMTGNQLFDYLINSGYSATTLSYNPKTNTSEFPIRIYKNTLNYDLDTTKIYLLVSDSSGNYGYSVNYVDPQVTDVSLSIQKNTEGNKLYAILQTKYFLTSMDIYYLNNGKWLDSQGVIIKSGIMNDSNGLYSYEIDFSSSNCLNKFINIGFRRSDGSYGYYKPFYYYIGPGTCSVKQTAEDFSSSKYLTAVISDTPFMGITLYSVENFEDDDSWIAKSGYTEIKQSAEGLYTVDNTIKNNEGSWEPRNVPAGFYYRTMIVFADGTCRLGEVHKKK